MDMSTNFLLIVILILLSTIVTSDIFRHIVAYLESCVTLAYSEHYHIQNPGIFTT